MVGCYSWVCLHTLLHVVVYYSEWLRKVWNCSNFWANNSQYFFCSVSPKRNATTLDPFTQLFQHCRGHTRAKDGCRIQVYKVSWDCFLPTMHCRSQHCWEFVAAVITPLTHRCKNSLYCWPNNVGSCYARLPEAIICMPVVRLVCYLKMCFYRSCHFHVRCHMCRMRSEVQNFLWAELKLNLRKDFSPLISVLRVQV